MRNMSLPSASAPTTALSGCPSGARPGLALKKQSSGAPPLRRTCFGPSSLAPSSCLGRRPHVTVYSYSILRPSAVPLTAYRQAALDTAFVDLPPAPVPRRLIAHLD